MTKQELELLLHVLDMWKFKTGNIDWNEYVKLNDKAIKLIERELCKQS